MEEVEEVKMIDRLQWERFSGFSEDYDQYRPSAPIEKLRLILGIYGSVDNITVADLGCGTGLSTIPWAKYVKHVFGIEPNPEMIRIAQGKITRDLQTKIVFREGEATRIPIGNNKVHLVTCSQSFHWMEPAASLKEFYRILKPDGLLAIYDCDWPPGVGEALELRFNKIIKGAGDVLKRNNAQAKQWPKELHLENIRASNLFRFQREICFETTLKLNAQAYIGMIESQGSVQQAIKEENRHLMNMLEDTKREILEIMQGRKLTAVMTYRLRLAKK